jgi:hypothetical protein
MSDVLDHYIEGQKALARQATSNLEKYAEADPPMTQAELKTVIRGLEVIIHMAEIAESKVQARLIQLRKGTK